VTAHGVRIGVGTRFSYDGEVAEIIEVLTTQAGNEVVLKAVRDQSIRRMALRELLNSSTARVIADGPGPGADDDVEIAGVVLAQLSDLERAEVTTRAEHVREVLTGYKSGHSELPQPGEPRPEFDPQLPMEAKYAAKSAELAVTDRTIKRWVRAYRQLGVAGLANETADQPTRTDGRWIETALEVMVEHTDQSRPSQKMVIDRTNARVVARFGDGVVKSPSRATGHRILAKLEKQHPTFHLSTKRNRDIADRPTEAYGKLRPTRPGEYLLMDTTRLDVFALDPVTLRWMQAELTVGMDWYTRCVTGIRVTPVSTKSVDAAAVLYQAYRPRPADKDWPKHAVWPEHGIPRSVLIDVDAVEGPLIGAAGPTIVPETIVIDHGKIYVSDHLTSVCQRMGISIQPARLRTGRDKGLAS
jgi:transposase